MQFRIISNTAKSSSSSRLSQLEFRYNDEKVVFSMPNALLYTRFGSIPFLTADIVGNLPRLSNIAFGSMKVLVEKKKVFTAFKQGLLELSRLKMPLFLFQNDPIDDFQASVYSDDSVSVWATGGRLSVTIDDYVDVAKLGKCQFLQSPVDNETKKSERESLSRKRTLKSVNRTQKFQTKFNTLIKEEDSPGIFVSIAGGNCADMRKMSIESSDFSRACGVAIDGVHFSSLHSPERFKVDELIHTISSLLPENLAKFLSCVFQPGDIVKYIDSGIDIFDGSLPYRLSRAGIAWIYSSQDSKLQFFSFPDDEKFYKELDAISFNSVLQKDCKCHTCKTYSLAYINHLHSVSEMLAQVLLMIHNIYQHNQFFEDIRSALSQGTFENFLRSHENDYFPEELLERDFTSEQPPSLKRKGD